MPAVFTLVSGNAGKLAQFKRLLSDVEFATIDIDLPEIQSMDSAVIIRDKAERAFAAVGSPVVVEDVSVCIPSLGGLPGPFIKFFEQQLGKDALYKVAQPDEIITVTCTIGYYDGTNLAVIKGTVEGTTISPRGDNGFGFDCCFIPNSQEKTYAEMSPIEKDAISHRSIAVRELVKILKK